MYPLEDQRARGIACGRRRLADDWTAACDDVIADLRDVTAVLVTRFDAGDPDVDNIAKDRAVEILQKLTRLSAQHEDVECCPTCHLMHFGATATSNFVAANTQRGASCCLRGHPFFYHRDVPEHALSGECLAQNGVLTGILTAQTTAAITQRSRRGYLPPPHVSGLPGTDRLRLRSRVNSKVPGSLTSAYVPSSLRSSGSLPVFLVSL